jgi:choline kinase
MDAIIPAAGLATRMRGIPKFLLPCDDRYTTLIERHIEALLQICKTVWIPTRPEMVLLLDSLGLARERVVILPMQTENMTQTVTKVLEIAHADNFQLVMPDTYYDGDQPYEILESAPQFVDLACWGIRSDQRGKLGQVDIADGIVLDIRDKDLDCEYEYSWGALTFNRKLIEFSKPSYPHIGYAVEAALRKGQSVTAKNMNGKYFDCGTPSEYLAMLQEVIPK